MIITTDHVVIGILLYFFYSGWRKGFFRTLLGPISMIIGCFMGFSHYQKTHNMATSLAVCIFSPFVIGILVSLLMKLWHKAVNNKKSISPVSRVLGSSFSILWGGGYLAMVLILIGIAPVRIGWFEKVQKSVSASRSYTIINRWVGDKIPIASFDIKNIANILQDPAKLKRFKSTEEFKTLVTDERLKNLFSDEETTEQIRNKDYGKLLSNPKMQAIFQDKQLLEKMFAFNKKIIDEQLGGELE